MLKSDDSIEVLQVFVSPGHNFFGHHGREASAYPTVEVETVECLAGRGLRGDRFLDYKADYAGQVTFFANEVFVELCAALGVRDRPPAVLRRNVLTRGADLNALVGREFTVQGVRFAGMAECKPCYWMDAAFAPGAEEWLRGRGGLRARILTDGVLRAKQTAVLK
jgi:MOSC domain-containing protein YiiM